MSIRNISKLAFAVAAICGGSAHALDLNVVAFNEADPNQVTIRVGGSSAHDNGLQQLMRLTHAGGAEICKAGTLDVYMTSDKNARLFYCQAGADSGLAATKRLAIFKRSNGGSGTGIATVLRPGVTSLTDGSTVAPNYLDVSNAAVKGAAGVAFAADGNFAAYTLHSGITTTGTTIAAPLNAADVGISDIEPNKFYSIFVPSISASEDNAIKNTTFGISSVIFGFAVTNGVYERLQAVEFAPTNACNPNNAGYAAVANTEGCMPSLTKAQLQAILTGNYSDWSQIQSSHTAGLDVSTATTPTYPTDLASIDSAIYVGRRALSSGTEASFEIYNMAQRCIAGSPVMVDKGTDPVHVDEGSSGTQVVTNLNAKETAGLGAIGILSTEVPPTAVDKYRFIKIQGYAPSVLNVVKSNYDFFYESTLQYRGTAINGLPALTGDKKTLADKIVGAIGSPNVVNDLDRTFLHPNFGYAGLLGNAVANAANAPVPPLVTGAYNSGNTHDVLAFPIATKTRGVSGTVNACLPPVDVSNTQAGI
ncbi:MAG: hypothetical protein HY749_25180 [Gammaproteobacteria bacterium]|nr:hypothetical protein [Gammaproteobacteria bacterium]